MRKHIHHFALRLFSLLFILLSGLGLYSQDVYLHWAKVLTGKGSISGEAVAVNSIGDVYITGSYLDTIDFDPGNGVTLFNTVGASNRDIFVSKLDASGNYSHAYTLPGTGTGDLATAIVVDQSDNIYTSGYFYDTIDFNPAPNDSFILTAPSQTDIFLSKFNTANNFVWAKSLGAGNQQSTRDIALDNSGNVYSTGLWVNDLFIYKANPQGDTLWTRRYPALNQVNPGYAVATDAQNNLYVTGYYWGMSILPNNNTPNIFAMKFDSAGTLLYAKGIGGTQWDFGLDVTPDEAGNAYVTGYFTGVVDFNPGTATSDTFFLTSSGVRDAFVVKLDASGNFVWAKGFGGSGNDSGGKIVTDSEGNLILAGSFEDTITIGISTLIASGGADAFLSKMDTSGNFLWAKPISGTGTESIRGMTLDGSNNIYLTGAFTDTTDLDPETDVLNFDTEKENSGAAFIIKLSQSPISGASNTLYSSNFSIYPNPSSELLHIALNAHHSFVSAEVVDINGQKVFEEKVNTQNRITITTNNYSPGIYLLRLQNLNGEISVKRFVKQ